MHSNNSTKDVVVDAAIAAGGAFFGAMVGVLLVAGVEALWAAGIAAGVAFFSSLAAARKHD